MYIHTFKHDIVNAVINTLTHNTSELNIVSSSVIYQLIFTVSLLTISHCLLEATPFDVMSYIQLQMIDYQD